MLNNYLNNKALLTKYLFLDAALLLQISSVFVPNLIMFFAFWFWGVIEGEFSTGDDYPSNMKKPVLFSHVSLVLNCKMGPFIVL